MGVSVYFFHPVPLELNSRTSTSKISCAINATNKLNNSTLFLCQCLRTVAYDDTRATAERIPNVSRWHRLSHKKVMADEDDLGLAIPLKPLYEEFICGTSISPSFLSLSVSLLWQRQMRPISHRLLSEHMPTHSLVVVICFEELKNCHMTPCGHNFCKECIDECLNRKPRCPFCNKSASTKDLVKNHHLEKLLGIIKTENTRPPNNTLRT